MGVQEIGHRGTAVAVTISSLMAGTTIGSMAGVVAGATAGITVGLVVGFATLLLAIGYPD